MKIRTQLIVGYVSIFILIIIIALVTYFNTIQMIEKDEWVNRTHEIVSKTILAKKYLVDMETGERGFLITGKEEFLEPYFLGKKQYEFTISELEKLIAHNSSQVKLLKEIENMVSQWDKTALTPFIDIRRNKSQSWAELREQVAQGKGKNVMDKIRKKIDEFIDVENILLNERLKESKNAANRSIFISFVASLFAILFGVVTMLVIIRRLLARVSTLVSHANKIEARDFTFTAKKYSDELNSVSTALYSISFMLKDYMAENDKQNWQKTGIANLSEVMRGEKELTVLCNDIITFLAKYLNAFVGTISVVTENNKYLTLTGSYAYKKHKKIFNDL